MILGEIDLSIGAMYLFAPILFYKLDTPPGWALVPGVIIALLSAWRSALINGFFVAVVGVSSFVTTLACCSRFEGLALIISHGDARRHARRSSPLDGSQRPPRRQRAHIVLHEKSQPHRHVRENLRRRHLLRADLGGA